MRLRSRSPPAKGKRPTGKSLAAGPWAWQARHVCTIEWWRDTSAFVFEHRAKSLLLTSPHEGSLATWGREGQVLKYQQEEAERNPGGNLSRACQQAVWLSAARPFMAAP